MSEKKKKFFVVTTIPLSFIFFKGQLKVLNDNFDVHIVSSPEQKLFDVATTEGVKAHPISMAREISLFKDFKALIAFIVLFLKEKPYYVHGNTPKGSFLSMLAAFITRRPVRIYYLHGLRYQGAVGLKRKLLIYMEKITCFCATSIFAVSNGVKDIAEKELTKKKIQVIGHGSPNGIDLDFFSPNLFDKSAQRNLLNIPADNFVFGFVGRFVKDKGLNELIAVFDRINAEFPKTKLLLVGFFEDELDPLESKTKETINNHPSIINVGFQKDVRPFLVAMDCFVFPSYREGFGLTLIEANAMGVPVISSRITGCDEIVQENVNGILIESKDEPSLEIAMLKFLNSENFVSTLKEKCRASIEYRFNQKEVWKLIVSNYLQLKK